MDMLSHCYMSVIWDKNHVWQAWISKQTMIWPWTSPQTCSAVTLDIGTNRLKIQGPHQWCSGSGPRMMIPGWIWYASILLVLYETWTMSDRGESSHRPPHDLQLHPRHTQLLPWILEEPRAWTMLLISGVVVHGWWHRYGYAIAPLYECSMRHGICLTGFYNFARVVTDKWYGLQGWLPTGV